MQRVKKDFMEELTSKLIGRCQALVTEKTVTEKGKMGGRISPQGLKFSRCFGSQAERPGLGIHTTISLEQGEGIFHVGPPFPHPPFHPPIPWNSLVTFP